MEPHAPPYLNQAANSLWNYLQVCRHMHVCLIHASKTIIKKTFYINASNFVPHRCPGSVPASQKEVKRTINSSK